MSGERSERALTSYSKAYCGRFAPSPTGPLHFGSLIAAVGSYLQARNHNGRWLLRIEDLDVARTVPGATFSILHTLERFGFDWDGEVVHQRRRTSAYAQALDELRRCGLAYACACSRREIADSAVSSADGPIYPGTCRHGITRGRTGRAWRVRAAQCVIAFDDRVQGRTQVRLADAVGDFVVCRADGFFAYQLAVAIDDAAQDVTEIVRGADLLDSTVRQIYLQRMLGLPTPDYAHLPVAVNRKCEKLSKQTHAAPVDADEPIPVLMDVLRFLNQPLPAADCGLALDDLWQWAIAHWDIERVPPVRLRRTDAV